MDSTDPRITRLLATLRFGKSVATDCNARNIALLYSAEDARVVQDLLEQLGSPLYHTHPRGFRSRREVEQGFNIKPRAKAPRKPEQEFYG